MKVAEAILQFKEIIYQKLKNNHSTYSAYYIQGDFLTIFKKTVNLKDLLYYFRNDNRFVFLNNDHIILVETLEKIVCNLSDKDDEEIINFLKDNYFLKSVHKDVIEKARNQSKKNRKFVTKYDNRVYEIMDEKEFIDMILEETYVTYEILEAFAKFTDKPGAEILKDAIERNVEIKEDRSVRYAIEYKEYGSSAANRNKKVSEYLYSPSPDTKKIKKEDDENILLLDLRTNELIACLIMLSYFRNETKINCNVFLPRHIKALKKLGIISVYDKNLINVTTIGEALIDDFYESLEDRTSELHDLAKKLGNVRKLAKSKETKYLHEDTKTWEVFGRHLKKIYLNNYYSFKLLKIIDSFNKIECYNLGEMIIKSTDMYSFDEILGILIQEVPTCGIKPIIKRTDVCFDCKRGICFDNHEDIYIQLIRYRGKYIKELFWNISAYEKLLHIARDPLLIKFLVPYYLCNRTKQIFIKLKLIENTKILYKDTGQYCPFDDMWVITNDILV